MACLWTRGEHEVQIFERSVDREAVSDLSRVIGFDFAHPVRANFRCETRTGEAGVKYPGCERDRQTRQAHETRGIQRTVFTRVSSARADRMRARTR
jgi:hypothetical protein